MSEENIVKENVENEPKKTSNQDEKFKEKSVKKIQSFINSIRELESDTKVNKNNIDKKVGDFRTLIDNLKAVYMVLNKIEELKVDKKAKNNLYRILDIMVKEKPEDETFDLVEKTLRKEVAEVRKRVINKEKEDSEFKF